MQRENALHTIFFNVEKTAAHNQAKVLDAFIKHRVDDSHLQGTTGYGYDDAGREVIEKVFADVLGAEDSLVRHSFANGTHAIATCLYAALRPGDTLLCVTGKPYDTLHNVIGIGSNRDIGSLADYGIGYKQIELLDGGIDVASSSSAISDDRSIRAVLMQKSRGYSHDRQSLTTEQINQAITKLKQVNPNIIFIVDNCYGELTEQHEPNADLLAGSLIKNLGGGIAPCGGYIAGKREHVEQCAYRLTVAGQGKEIGATLGINRAILQGLFLSPMIIAEAIKTAIFAADVFAQHGYYVNPTPEHTRTDIIQSITLGSAEKVSAFCRGIQSASPINSYVTPEPWAMPGYAHDVIMAAGTFTQGASVELSADAIIAPPYNIYMQGGLSFHAAKFGVINALNYVNQL